MSFNLKNRSHPPKRSMLKKTTEYDLCCEEYCDLDAWFEGFTKQESKRLSDARSDLEKSSSKDARHCGFLAGYITAKKEILGE